MLIEFHLIGEFTGGLSLSIKYMNYSFLNLRANDKSICLKLMQLIKLFRFD